MFLMFLMFGWLKVAEILQNPFGKNELYDINLTRVLDLNIWKSSLLIESQERFLDTNFGETPAPNYSKYKHFFKNTKS